MAVKRKMVVFPKPLIYTLVAITSLLVGFGVNYIISELIFTKDIAVYKEVELDQKIELPVRKSATKVLKQCSTSDAEQCMAKAFGRLTEETSLAHALDTLSAVQTVSESARGCHLISHAISIAETKKDPTKWEDVVGKVPPVACTGGFIHGVIEAYMGYDQDFKLSATTIPDICALVDKKTGYTGKDFDCSHIMGHLLMVETGGFVDPAKKICDEIPEKLRYECYSGIFMENETRENLIVHQIKSRLKWDKTTTKAQEELCQQHSGLAGQACWREISHMYAFISNDNPQALYDYCDLAPSQTDKDDCYLHGIGVIGVSYRLNEKDFPLFCTPYSENERLYAQCMSVTIGSMLTSTPEYTARAIRFCNATEKGRRTECFTNIGEQLSYLVAKKAERERYCKSAPKKYMASCVGGALGLNK